LQQFVGLVYTLKLLNFGVRVFLVLKGLGHLQHGLTLV
jgi:hypothetical protein